MKIRMNHILSLLACTLVGLLNQNCGNQSSFSLDDLAANHSPSMLDVDLPESQAKIGDRIYTSSVLADVFFPQGEEISVEDAEAKAGEESHHIADYITSEYDDSLDGSIFSIINEFVLNKITEFYGLCSVVDGDSTCNARNLTVRTSSMDVQSTAPSAVTRDGYRITACNKIVAEDRAVGNVIFNLTGSRETDLSEEDIMKVYNAFYPEQSISAEAYASLVEVYESVVGELILDKWRAVIIPICQSSGWQVQ